MRSDLKAAGVTKIETDLDENCCSFEISSSVNVKVLLNKLAKENNKMKDWSYAN